MAEDSLPPCVDYNSTTCSNASALSLNATLWTTEISNAASGIIATIYLLIFIVAFSANLFIIVFMLARRKLLNEPSSVFLFCLAVIDFLEAVLSIPFYVVSLAAGGWIFGSTDFVRQIFCDIIGFCLSLFISLSIYTLGAVSFDRFLYICFAIRYSKIMKPWRAWLLILLICLPPIVLSSTPFYGFGRFFYRTDFAACLFRWIGESNYVIAFCLMMLVPAQAIITFTLISYCYVRCRFRRRSSSQMTRQSTQTRMRVISRTRIFIALLIAQLACFAPGLTIAFVGFFTTYDNIPGTLLLITFFIIHANAAVNPVIQSYFRRPVRQFIIEAFQKIKRKLFTRSHSNAEYYDRERSSHTFSETKTDSSVTGKVYKVGGSLENGEHQQEDLNTAALNPTH